MCGIVGTTSGKIQDIQNGLNILHHRGPDQSGVFADSNVILGHTRLSIIDLSEKGKQPIVTEDETYAISFNGEIYNYKELRKELEQSGVVCRTHTDTEVILLGYRKEGTAFFKKLRGMWAFALYSKKTHEIILSRDQFGIKPLYYSTRSGSLSFASELKAFASLGVKLEPNTAGFYTFFNLGYFIAPETCYRDVFSLVPGEIITYSLERDTVESVIIETETEFSGQPELTEETIVDNLDQTLLDSVRAHYVSDVPVSILFSGGSDSSLIAALSKEAGFTPVSYHLSIEGSSDTEYAKKIANHLGSECNFIEMDKRELINQYHKVWDVLDAPFADISIIPTSLIYQKIKGQSKVVLSGEGGDEWFGGYRRHARMAHAKNIQEKGLLFSALDLLYGQNNFSLTTVNPVLSRIQKYALENLGDDVIGAYLRAMKLIDFPLHKTKIRNQLFSLYTHSTFNNISSNLFFDRYMYLSNDLLYKNDMASMASSVEARVPLVDRKVFDYVLHTVPEKYCLSREYSNKYLLKKVLRRYLPEDLVYRKKAGFSFSFERYNIEEFKDDVQKALEFHRKYADTFGLVQYKTLLNPSHEDIFIKKYSRFAFGLVSNWKIFRALL